MSDPKNYTVGWICAIVTEYVAAQAYLDERHDPLEESSDRDNNDYTLGKIGKHNIVIAVLPNGEYGASSAAGVARDMLHTFPNVRIGLMVGIGGGAPSRKHDIRLGDIVVSVSSKGSGAVFQYNFGEVIQGQEFREIGCLNQAPSILRTAVSGLKAHYEMEGHRFQEAIDAILDKKPRLRKKYERPQITADRLYRSQCMHRSEDEVQCAISCGDDPSCLVQRTERGDDDDNPAIHYGLIASANTLIKNALTRDKFIEKKDVLCFETEAAGLMNHFPCLVIRGICDYSDSHNNSEWHGYAAMTAAAYAKDLLYRIVPKNIEKEKRISEVIDEIKDALGRAYDQNENYHRDMIERALTKEQLECHQVFKTSSYEQHKNLNPKRVKGTCRWILENSQYLAWLRCSHNDLLWISADPGCGKSVLAKSLIDIDLKKGLNSATSVCYFFFKDNDEQNSSATALCALLHQLLGMQPDLIRHALPVWKRNGTKLQQEVDGLWGILEAVVSDSAFSNTICILDALDECRPSDQAQLIRKLEEFYTQTHSSNRRSWIKFLVTSRPYDEIKEGFRPATQLFPHIHVRGEEKNDLIREEISLVVKMRIAKLGERVRIAPKTLQQLEQQLLQMQHRTYLWLHLAMEDIRITFQESLRPEEESIRLIPSSVSAAYRRILNRVPPTKTLIVKMILQIIVGARRPLLIEEMAMALGIAESAGSRTAVQAGLNAKGLDEKIRHLCGLFVFINNSRIYLIHQTAKEFLLSEGQEWSLQQSETETLLSDICINLLNDIGSNPPKHNVEMAELLQYAAEYWPDHVREMPSLAGSKLEARVNQLYDTNSAQFTLWYPLFWKAVMSYRRKPKMNAIRLAAFNGHTSILQAEIIKNGSMINETDENGMNALHWASERGHFEIVQTLLDKGAEVNAQGGQYGNALQAASHRGHVEIVQTLLDKGAEVNAQGGQYSNALQAASHRGYVEIVQTLLDKGAEVNTQGGFYGNALQAASLRGHVEIVQTLLDKGAEVNTQGGFYGNALQAASEGGYVEIVQTLLDKGAEVNAQGGRYGNALQAASLRGHVEIVQTLLDKGAEVNAQGGFYGNALQAASEGGHVEIVQTLLDKGAEVNAQGGQYGNALQAASLRGHVEIVQTLLDKGAEVNAQGGRYGNALQAASLRGHVEIVQTLLDKGAEVNAQGGEYSNALQAASEGGHVEIVQTLLDKGAEVNAQGGEYGNALHAASEGGHVEIMQTLLDKGAEVNAQGGEYSNALQAASLRGHVEIVQTLLDKGAEVNAQGGFYGNALQAASEGGHVEIVQTLLDKGAEVNTQGGQYSNALQAASEGGYVEIVQTLLDKGAEVNAQGGRYGNALQAASLRGHVEIVQTLLDKGAEVNAQGGEYGNALHAASHRGHVEIVQTLLDKGAEICQDTGSLTPDFMGVPNTTLR